MLPGEMINIRNFLKFNLFVWSKLINIFKVNIITILIILTIFNNNLIATNTNHNNDNDNNNNNNHNLIYPVDNTDWQDLTWHPNKSVRLCSGCYLEPKYPLEITKHLVPNTLVINSNKTKLISKGRSRFDGNVVVAKNNQKLTADHVIVIQNSAGQVESFTAVGKVKLTEPGIRLLGNRGKLFLKDNRKIMYKANYRIYDKHATGNADHLEVLQDQIINMPNATYSTCAPNEQIWKLSAKQVKLNKNTGRGEAWHAKMYIKDTPIFYWPYVNFPLDKRRQTGFLLPIISSNSNDGFTLGIPWYWNIAPNYDYTFSPIYMSKRGVKFNNQFRYLTNKSFGVIRFNFLFKDREYKNYIKQTINNRGSIQENDLRYLKLFNSKNDFRYGIAYHNISNLDSLGKVYINYNRVSDDHYLKDFGKDLGQVSINSLFKVTKNHNKINNFYGAGAYLEELLHSSSLHLEQSINLENSNKYGALNIKFSQYQTLYPFISTTIEEQYKKIPEINWSHYPINVTPATYFKFNINYTDFKLKHFANLDPKTTGKRINFRPSLEYSQFNSYGYIKPRLQLDILNYHDLNLSNLDVRANKPRNTSRMMPIFDINNGVYLYRDIDVNWQQTLEPRIYYLYVPKRKQDHYPNFDSQFIEYSYHQLFRDNRYTGLDRLADANQVTFGLKTSLRKFGGKEKASFAIARTRSFKKLTPYLQENLVTSKWSPIAMLLNYNLSPKWSLETNLVMDQLNKFRNTSIESKHLLGEDKIINLSYQYSKHKEVPEHQLQASSIWVVNDRLSLLGKIDYDLNRKRFFYSLAGLEFNGCCTIVRFAIARSLLTTENLVHSKYNNKFLAQIVFKGFTELGDLEDNYLSGKIPGYRSYSKYN